jgi:hypothetical protein
MKTGASCYLSPVPRVLGHAPVARVADVLVMPHLRAACRHCGHVSEDHGGCGCAIGKPCCVACGCPRARPLNAPDPPTLSPWRAR